LNQVKYKVISQFLAAEGIHGEDAWLSLSDEAVSNGWTNK
jgi:hypothetical protein